jgi:drug/metabolite transporter (DMT)-like permease
LSAGSLRGGAIDAVSFTGVRLAAGALTLLAIARFSGRTGGRAGGWLPALALFGYAIAFSLAYVRLPAGLGALVLFAAVQATMIGGGIRAGERPRPAQWAGIAVALGGLVLLAAPGRHAPGLLGIAAMTVSGAAWGVYSLLGRRETFPLHATARNFLLALPPAAAASLASLPSAHGSALGVLLAAVSGSVTSGCAYVLWYAALPALGTTRAAAVQLAVPILAALGGVALLDEPVTLRLCASAAAILGGVFIATRR